MKDNDEILEFALESGGEVRFNLPAAACVPLALQEPSAYYNENDPKAAAWLRELMRGGLITKGEVDERSIADVRGADLAGFTRCHFFAGIGGWDYALQLAGWPADEPVWTGSCPCQPFSQAGKGAGESDSRHLWPHLRRLIEECRPATVFGEQVASKAGRRWLDGVRTDLEALDHEVGAADLCSPGVRAPHIRQRLYWVADAGYERARRARSGEETRMWPLGDTSGRRIDCTHCNSTGRFPNGNKCYCCAGRGWRDLGGLDDTAEPRRSWDGIGRPDSAPRDETRLRESSGSGPSIGLGESVHSERRALDGPGQNEFDGDDAGRPQAHGESGTPGEVRWLGDSHNSRSQGRRIDAGEHASECVTGPAGAVGGVEHAGRERDEHRRIAGVVASAGGETESEAQQRERRGHADSDSGATCGLADSAEHGRRQISTDGRRGAAGSNSQGWSAGLGLRGASGFWDAFDIVHCTDNKARRVEPGTFPLAHGISARMGRLRGYGNAIVPQVAAEFVAAYQSLGQGRRLPDAAGKE